MLPNMPESPGLRFSSLSKNRVSFLHRFNLTDQIGNTLQIIGLSCRAAKAGAFRSDCSASLSDSSTDFDSAIIF